MFGNLCTAPAKTFSDTINTTFAPHCVTPEAVFYILSPHIFVCVFGVKHEERYAVSHGAAKNLCGGIGSAWGANVHRCV